MNDTTGERPGAQSISARPVPGTLAPLRKVRGLARWRRSVRPTPRPETQPGTHKALQESEQRFHSAFDHAPGGMALISPDTGYIQVNSAFCDMVGRSEKELIGTWAHDITHPDDLELDRKGWQPMVSGKVEQDSVDKRYIHADGHAVWARVDLSAVQHADGSPAYAIVQAIDLTERKEAEAALHEPPRDW